MTRLHTHVYALHDTLAVVLGKLIVPVLPVLALYAYFWPMETLLQPKSIYWFAPCIVWIYLHDPVIIYKSALEQAKEAEQTIEEQPDEWKYDP